MSETAPGQRSVEVLASWWEAMYEHVLSDPANEVGGVLMGRRAEDEQSVASVTGIIPALAATGDITSLTFTHEAWARINEIRDRDFPDDEMVGWYHSHPGHGIFLSEHDRFIHHNFFSAGWQIAVVIDPQRAREGVFAWIGGTLTELVERPCGESFWRFPGAPPRRGEAAAAPPPAASAPPSAGPPPRVPSPPGLAAAARPPRPAAARPPAARAADAPYPLGGLMLSGTAGLVVGVVLAVLWNLAA